MTVSTVGAAFLVAGLVALVRPRALVWVLAASAALPTTAAITYHGNSAPPFFVLGVLTVPFLVLPLSDLRRRPPAALVALVGFVLVALVVTAVGPHLFAGTPILLPRGGIDAEIAAPTPLAYTTSTLAQCGYLVLGVAAAIFIGRRVGAGSRLPEATFVTGIGLCTAQWVWEQTGHRWPRELFENYANVTINRFEPRFHGVFPEPSYLAVFGMASAAYFVVRLGRARGWGLVLPVVMIGLSLLNLWLSRSSTAAVAVVVVALLGYLTYTLSLFFRRRIPPVAWVIVLLPIGLAAAAAHGVDRITALVTDKRGSLSGEHRFAADRFSLDLVRETHGLGVGLGANRPASFAPMVVSCTGVVGGLLLLAALVLLIRQAVGRPEMRAAAWSLIALVVTKCIGEPDLSVPVLYVLIGVLLASANRPAARRTTRSIAATSGAGKRRAGVPQLPPAGAGKHRLPG